MSACLLCAWLRSRVCRSVVLPEIYGRKGVTTRSLKLKLIRFGETNCPQYDRNRMI